MNSDWTPTRCADFIEFNPRLSLKKGTVATKISMDKLRPFTKKIQESERAAFSGGAKFTNGDTIMARITPCLENGKTAFVDCLAEGEIAFGSTEFIVLRAKREISDARFLYYLATSSDFRGVAIKSMVGTSGRQRVQQSVLEEWTTRLPPLETQRKIAAVLSALDDKIELNRRINANLEQQARALYRAWFIDYLPYNGIKPQSWTTVVLGEVSKMGAGGDKPNIVVASKTNECPYPVYSNGISEAGLYGYTNEPKINVESVTVSARGTIGFVCLRPIPYVPIVRLITLIPKNEIVSAKFLYLCLRELDIAGTGTTQQQLTVPDFKKRKILVPDKETMARFTEAIEPFYEKCWANEEENKQLAAVRDALLPRLMSGEIDVSNVAL